MVDNQNVRASDADRDRVAAALQEHCAAGRLTVEEVGERLDRTYAARTLGELAEVIADLPPLEAHPLPVPTSGSRPVRSDRLPARGSRGGGQVALRHQAVSWASTSLTVSIIWLVIFVTGGGTQAFWPIWVIGPWGATILVRALTDRFDR